MATPNTYGTLINEMIQGNRQALGPDFLRGLLRRRAMRTYLNQRRRGDVSSKLFGLDPAQARAAAASTEAAASGNLSNSLNEAELADAQNQQGYLRSLVGGERGFEQSQQAADAADARSRRGAFGGFLGQLAGGAGSALVGRIPNPFRRRRQTQTDYSGGSSVPGDTSWP